MSRDKRLYELRLKLDAYLKIEDFTQAKRVFNEILSLVEAEKAA